MATERARTTALWFLTGILALIFIFAGGSKLMGHEMEVDHFERWGYTTQFLYLVGFVELAGAILLLWPRAAWIGGGLLAGDMVGAVVTHIRFAEWVMMFVAATLGILAVFVAYVRRPAFARPGYLGFASKRAKKERTALGSQH